MIFQGRKYRSGRADGEALVTSMGISFYGGVDPETGKVVEKGHALEGQSIAGKVLVFPTGKGSTVGSYTLYRLEEGGERPGGHPECGIRDDHSSRVHHFRHSVCRPPSHRKN